MNNKSRGGKKADDQCNGKENNSKIPQGNQAQSNNSSDEGEDEELKNKPTSGVTPASEAGKHQAEPSEENRKTQVDSHKFQSNPETDNETATHSGHTSSVPRSREQKREKRPFPKTKKYRYYPVTCEYCREHMQPTELKAHQQKHHPDIFRPSPPVKPSAPRKDPGHKGESKKAGGIGGRPRLQICYICGRMYGTKSLEIHEPNCLVKWRIQNEQLPPRKRAPEPVKPEPIAPVAGKKGYSVPGFDPGAEAAYQSHLKTLIPCSYCSRTFSPDRIMVHESCCIERPKKRKRDTSKKRKKER